MKTSLHRSGFTVLELIIVIGIMCILIALVLTGLNSARSHSKDEGKVAHIRTVVIGIQQYFNVCRQYPATLAETESCTDSQGQQVTLKDLVPDVAIYKFNQPDSDYMYAAFAIAPGFDPTADPNNCVAFHIGAKLANSNLFSEQKSGFDSANAPELALCGTSAGDFRGSDPKTFDIKK